MVIRGNWHRISIFSVAFIVIVGFGLLLVSRFHDDNVIPASNNVPVSTETARADTLQPTDKVELSQTDLIEVKPSEMVTKAEQSMPAESAKGYMTACQKLKALYTSEHVAKNQAENERYKQALQQIINKYSKEGMSFSTAQKLAQIYEGRRHELIMNRLQNQLQTQLKNLNC